MKIPFSKLNSTPQPFEIKLENMAFSGEIKRKNAALATLTMSMSGFVPYICDTCGSEFTLKINEQISLLLSDGIYEDAAGKMDDVVEFFDGSVDLSALAQGELDSFLSDYFYCEECENLEH